MYVCIYSITSIITSIPFYTKLNILNNYKNDSVHICNVVICYSYSKLTAPFSGASALLLVLATKPDSRKA